MDPKQTDLSCIQSRPASITWLILLQGHQQGCSARVKGINGVGLRRAGQDRTNSVQSPDQQL